MPTAHSSFDLATRIRPGSDPDRFDVDIDPAWTVGDKPNGGYLLALLAQAARHRVNSDKATDSDALASSITYLGAPDLGPAVIETTVLRQGRTAVHVRAVITQNDAALVDAVFVMGTVPEATSPRYNDVPPLEAAPPEDCVRLKPAMPSGVHVGMLDVTDLRLDLGSLPLASSGPEAASREAELRGWTRFDDGRPPDPLSLLYFADAIPPATFPIGSSGWVPTLQMSVYVRARPAPGWLGVRFTAHVVAGGMVDETCTLWDSRGYVVAQATQLARLRFPDEVA
ncbi:MAG TPA: thioesterase family protein [Acidimicrobiales bacterium]|nr:thioesterase family protein [Acidimicrobiales bacterium]